MSFGITEKTLKNLKVSDPVKITKNGMEYNGQVTEIGSMVNAATGLYDAKASVEPVSYTHLDVYKRQVVS